jgi:transposase-like protein
MLPDGLPQDLPTFIARFGTDEQCRGYLVRQRWPDGFRCRACGHGEAWALARRLGRLRLQAVSDASAKSLAGFLARNVAPPAAVTTDGWHGYAGLDQAGYAHEPINLSRSWGDAALRLPGIHLVFGLAKRWLLGTHHGAVSPKHLQAYLDEYVFRFNRRTAKSISHRFARLLEQAALTPPAIYRAIVGGAAPA